MSAYEIPNLRFALNAGGTVSRRRFVKLDSSGNGVQAGNGDAAIGVSSVPVTVNQVLEVYDGIVIVEAGAAVACNSIVQSDASGKAITRTAGIALGMAITSAAASGELIAIKTPAVSVGANVHIITIPQALLAAGVDIAAVPLYVVPTGFKFTVTAVDFIAQGSSAGIDASNTSVFAIKVSSTTLATKTYTDVVVFPATGVAGNLGTITSGLRVAGDIITLSITNGTTAATPALILQITGTLESV